MKMTRKRCANNAHRERQSRESNCSRWRLQDAKNHGVLRRPLARNRLPVHSSGPIFKRSLLTTSRLSSDFAIAAPIKKQEIVSSKRLSPKPKVDTSLYRVSAGPEADDIYTVAIRIDRLIGDNNAAHGLDGRTLDTGLAVRFLANISINWQRPIAGEARSRL